MKELIGQQVVEDMFFWFGVMIIPILIIILCIFYSIGILTFPKGHTHYEIRAGGLVYSTDKYINNGDGCITFANYHICGTYTVIKVN